MNLPIPVRGLHHFAYRCRDAEETRHFYEDILGLPLTHFLRAENVPSTGEHCPYVHLFFEMTDGSSIAFFDFGDNQISNPSSNTPRWANHIALRVDSVEAVQSMRDRLIAEGVEVWGPIDHDGFVLSIYFFDPNGVRMEFTTNLASAAELQTFRDEARARCDAWTQEKAARQG